MSKVLKKKIELNKAVITVVGLGYVGLPLAFSFVKKGFLVNGLDLDQTRVEKLKQKKTYITDISNAEVISVMKSKKFIPTTDVSVIADSDVIIVCVPTPLKKKYTPDISYILGAIKTITKYIKKDSLVVLESTTYPGTTEELIVPELEKSGLKSGKDFYVSFSPERIDPGNKQFDVTQIPKVVGGVSAQCSELTRVLYQKVIKKVHMVSSPKAAEMTKLLENSFRIINIGWINEVAMACHHMDIDVWEVIDAAKTKPFGFMPFYPGLGVGGHCIPDDPLYLFWKAKQYGFHSKYIKLSADINSSMPEYAIGRLTGILNKPLNKAKVLVLGATYKKDVYDLRKSPSLKLIALLQKQKTKVDYHDPIVPYLNIHDLRLDSIELTPKNIKSYDCVIVSVDHTKVDYAMILRNAKQVFDLKNIYKETSSPKIIKL